MLDLSLSTKIPAPVYNLALDITAELPADLTYTRDDAAATYRDDNGAVTVASDNAPLIDHDENGAPRGIRIQPGATNKCENHNINPADLTGVAAYGAADLSLVEVDGRNVINISNTSGGDAGLYYAGAAGNTNPHCMSAEVRVISGTGGYFATTGAAGVQVFGNTQWQRITSDNFTPAAGTDLFAIVAANNTVIQVRYNQLEEGTVTTDIIQVAGASASRAAPLLRNAAPPLITAASGGIIVEYIDENPQTAPDLQTIFQYGAADTNNRIAVFKSTNGDLLFRITSSGVEQLNRNFGGGTIVAGLQKIAITWDKNTCRVFLNGHEIITKTNAAMPASVSYGAVFGTFAASALPFNGWIKSVTYLSRFTNRADMMRRTNIIVPVSGATYTAARNMVIIAGQSNATQIGEEAEPALSNTVYNMAADGVYKTYAAPYDDPQDAQFKSPWLYDDGALYGYTGNLLDDLTDEFGGEWACVGANKGGTGMLYSSDNDGLYYNADIGGGITATGEHAYCILQRIKQAASIGTVRAIIWSQGATDALAGADADAWAAASVEFLNECRSVCQNDAPIIRTIIQDKPVAGWVESEYPANTWNEIQIADRAMVVPNAAAVETQGIELQDDELHGTTAGYITLGNRIRDALISIINGT